MNGGRAAPGPVPAVRDVVTLGIVLGKAADCFTFCSQPEIAPVFTAWLHTYANLDLSDMADVPEFLRLLARAAIMMRDEVRSP